LIPAVETAGYYRLRHLALNGNSWNSSLRRIEKAKSGFDGVSPQRGKAAEDCRSPRRLGRKEGTHPEIGGALSWKAVDDEG